MGTLKHLKKIDIFGTNMELLVGKNKVHKTMIGAILTILVISIVFIFLIINTRNMFLRNNPIVLNQVKSSKINLF